jgi:hypothetical protein
MPVEELKGFKRLPLKTNEEGIASFAIALSELKKWDNATHAWKLNKGTYTITAGGNAQDAVLTAPITIK